MFITIDSNIVLSIFTKDSLYDASSSLMDKYHTHDYIINDCIYLELGVHFTNLTTLNEALDTLECHRQYGWEPCVVVENEPMYGDMRRPLM